MYRKPINETKERFRIALKKVTDLIVNGTDPSDIHNYLKTEYQEKEIIGLIENLRRLKNFKKVDTISVIYRILTILYFILLVVNLYIMTFLFNLQQELTSVETKIDFASPASGSLVGALIFIFVIFNAFKETALGDIFVMLLVSIFSSFAFDIFILFKESSIYHWIPIIIYLAIFVLSFRAIKGKRIELLTFSKQIKKSGLNLEPVFHKL